MAGIGASRPLRRIPLIVSFLNPEPALSLSGGNRSSCPKAVLPTKRDQQGRGGLAAELRELISFFCSYLILKGLGALNELCRLTFCSIVLTRPNNGVSSSNSLTISTNAGSPAFM
jgi:hypothetical protein